MSHNGVNGAVSVSERIAALQSFEFGLKDVFCKVSENPYNEKTNEKGVINMCTSNNSAVGELIAEKLNEPDLQKWDKSMLPYTSGRNGIPRLRKAIAEFLTKEFKAPVDLDPEKICIMSGVTAGLSMMGYVLCDKGDTILTPCPMYGAIPRDFLFLPAVKTFPVHLSSKPGPDGRQPFELTAEMLEVALEEAKSLGHRVKALLLTNPFNPLGTVYTKDQVMSYLQFCKKHDLHCVVDEIYGCSIYDKSVQMSSVLTFDPDQLPDKSKTHILWGFAKDFGVPGSPTGALYTWNPDVMQGMYHIIDFFQVPHFIQVAHAKLLEDKDWLYSKYFPANQLILRESSQITMAMLDELNVPYVKPSGGLFLYADFRKYLPEATEEEEKKLSLLFADHGVAAAHGAAFYAKEFGWFRLVFTIPREELIEAMKRVKQACLSISQQRA